MPVLCNLGSSPAQSWAAVLCSLGSRSGGFMLRCLGSRQQGKIKKYASQRKPHALREGNSDNLPPMQGQRGACPMQHHCSISIPYACPMHQHGLCISMPYAASLQAVMAALEVPVLETESAFAVKIIGGSGDAKFQTPPVALMPAALVPVLERAGMPSSTHAW
eukprot:1159721-Pelagomonas_calceolata.AAC.5